jgi:ADP-heptose:LPS heptosyltransferase
VEGFAAAAREMARLCGAPTLVLWGPPERAEALEIVAGAPGRALLAPPTTLREMAALLAHPALLVVTDCLARHFAVVQDVPTVGLFGTTDPGDWTPPEGPHRTIRGGPSEGYFSLRDLPAEPVLAAIRDHFAEGSLDTSRGDP